MTSAIKRVFLAVNLPLSVKKVIEDEVEKIKEKIPESVRFIPSENWHITVSFLGNQSDENIAKISDIAKKIAANFAPIEARLEKIVYGPSNANAKMIWLITDYETSSRLEIIKQMIENRLIEEGINLRLEHRKFNGHITLARFDKNLGVSELPLNLEDELELDFLARSLDFMESDMRPNGAEYSTLGKFEFFY